MGGLKMCRGTRPRRVRLFTRTIGGNRNDWKRRRALGGVEQSVSVPDARKGNLDEITICFVYVLFRIVLVVATGLPTLIIRADTIELKTGERLDGGFRQAGVGGVVIDAGGRAITIPLEKVKAIYFGTAPKTIAEASPAPAQDALAGC